MVSLVFWYASTVSSCQQAFTEHFLSLSLSLLHKHSVSLTYSHTQATMTWLFEVQVPNRFHSFDQVRKNTVWCRHPTMLISFCHLSSRSKLGSKFSNFNAGLCKFWQSRPHLLAAITLTCAMTGSDLEMGKETKSMICLLPTSYDKDLPTSHIVYVVLRRCERWKDRLFVRLFEKLLHSLKITN